MNPEPIVIVVASKALDGLSMRMAALADNLANVGSANFRTSKVDFERALQAAASRGAGAVANLKLKFEADRTFVPGDEHRMDLMLADAGQTAMRYSALIDMLGKRFSLQQAVIGRQ